MKSAFLLALAGVALGRTSIVAPRDLECDVCKKNTGLVTKEIGDNRTEENLIRAIENVCSLTPKRERTRCDTFVEQYANELIHVLVEEGDPGLACALLGVCVP